MDLSFEEKFIPTKVAGELSGYTSDYLARLARSGKVIGKRVGHSWFIDKHSLELFLSQQEDRKNEYVRALAREREAEYRTHSSFSHRVVKTFSKPLPKPSAHFLKSSYFEQALASLVALLIVTCGAYAAHAIDVPWFAEEAGAIVRDAASGFHATFGTTPSHIASNMRAVAESVHAYQPRVAVNIAFSTSRIALPLFAADITLSSSVRALFAEPQHITHESFSSRGVSLSASSTMHHIASLQDLQSGARDLFALLSSPTHMKEACTSGYRSLGEYGYYAINHSLAAYDDLLRHTGAFSLERASHSRDLFARAPRLALQAGGHVHGRAEIVEPVVQGHHHAGAHVDAELQRQILVGDAGLHGKGGAHRMGGVAERGHDGVADGLHHRAVMVAHEDRGLPQRLSPDPGIRHPHCGPVAACIVLGVEDGSLGREDAALHQRQAGATHDASPSSPTAARTRRPIASSRSISHGRSRWSSATAAVRSASAARSSRSLAQVAQSWGSDDVDGTVVHEKIYHAAGSDSPQEMTVADLRRLIEEAGRVPVERDTLYRQVIREGAKWRAGDPILVGLAS